MTATQITKNSTFLKVSNQHLETLKQHKEHEKAQWEELINIGEELKEQRKRIIKTLSKFIDMWDGHFGIIKATTHWT